MNTAPAVHIALILSLQKGLEQKLFDVCERLSSTSLKEQCENYVKTYLPMFFYILSQDLDPSVVCTELSICTAKSLAGRYNRSVIQGSR